MPGNANTPEVRHAMILRWRRLLTVCMVASSIGCAATRGLLVPGGASLADFFPLHDGTLWVYRVEDPSGEVSLQRVLVRGPRFLEQANVIGVVVEESGGLGGTFALDPSWHPIAYYRRGDFVYKHYGVAFGNRGFADVALDRDDEKLLPTDPAKTAEWESDVGLFDVSDGSGYALHVVGRAASTDASVTVPAGTFDGCLLVDTTISPSAERSESGEAAHDFFHYLDWYAPGIGLVKSIATSGSEAEPVSTIELVSFRDGRSSR